MNRMLISMTPLLSAAWPLLLDSSLKGATLLTLALILAFALRKASAAARHLVWLGAMAALLVLPILSGLLPGWRVLPAWTASAPRPAPAASARGEVPEFSHPTPAVMPAPAGAPLL